MLTAKATGSVKVATRIGFIGIKSSKQRQKVTDILWQ
jgi:hypothetical protein